MEGRGYLYPRQQLCYLQIAPPQLIYSSQAAGLTVIIQGESVQIEHSHVFTFLTHARTLTRRCISPLPALQVSRLITSGRRGPPNASVSKVAFSIELFHLHLHRRSSQVLWHSCSTEGVCSSAHRSRGPPATFGPPEKESPSS